MYLVPWLKNLETIVIYLKSHTWHYINNLARNPTSHLQHAFWLLRDPWPFLESQNNTTYILLPKGKSAVNTSQFFQDLPLQIFLHDFMSDLLCSGNPVLTIKSRTLFLSKRTWWADKAIPILITVSFLSEPQWNPVWHKLSFPVLLHIFTSKRVIKHSGITTPASENGLHLVQYLSHSQNHEPIAGPSVPQFRCYSFCTPQSLLLGFPTIAILPGT